MKKYYIGLVALALLTLGLLGFTIMQGSASKKDVTTEQKANEIATKLNSYISSKDKIPADLAEAGATDVPSSITYSRKSDEAYEVCVEYKTRSAFNDLSLASVATGIAASQLAMSSGGDLDELYGYSSYDSPASTYTPVSLYYYGGHKKGKNCQTVEPFQYSSYDKYNSSSSSSSLNDSSSVYDSDSSLDDDSSELSLYSEGQKICGVDGYYGIEDAVIEKTLTGTVTSSQSISLEYFSYVTDYEMSPNVQVFDKDCKATTLAALKIGDTVDAYYPKYDPSASDYSFLITVIKKQ